MAALSLGLVLTTGCATYSDRTREARGAAQRGDLPGAEKQVNKLLGTRSSKDMPTKWKKDTALALLERGMILHASGAYKLSARDLSVAEKQLELLDIARDGAGQLGKYVFSDSSTKYKAPPSEKLVLNAYNLLNYLLQGDLSGARVEAKRFTVMHEYLTSYDQRGRPRAEGEADVVHPHGAFGSWLAGFVFERLGEHESALRYYDEALQARPFASLVGPVQRLSALAGYRSPQIDAVLGACPMRQPRRRARSWWSSASAGSRSRRRGTCRSAPPSAWPTPTSPATAACSSAARSRWSSTPSWCPRAARSRPPSCASTASRSGSRSPATSRPRSSTSTSR
ncbi:hypothetical protein [Nannocystis pusilla]|uniref:hypothetical protein n=1 Tax=Nannocystis pusilla TaxID=889268 RepID=UPI003B7925F1